MEASAASDPSAFLSEIIGVPVTVKLNSGVVYKGMEGASKGNPATNLLKTQANSNLWTDT
jgi:U6 snRNA-associated Sm-like protein LSm6